jgi:hypothetical protein
MWLKIVLITGNSRAKSLVQSLILLETIKMSQIFRVKHQSKTNKLVAALWMGSLIR